MIEPIVAAMRISLLASCPNEVIASSETSPSDFSKVSWLYFLRGGGKGC